MKYIFIVFLFSISLIRAQQNNVGVPKDSQEEKVNQYHRARIYYQNPMGLSRLASQGVPLDHGKHKRGIYIESDFSDNDLGIAEMFGMKVEILIEDVVTYYKEQNNKGSQESGESSFKNGSCTSTGTPTYSTPANWEQGSMGGFYTYTEMLSELDDMAAQYPNLITTKSPISNFQTFEGRSIYWVKISDNPNSNEAEPEMLYDAIHHAREPAAMQQLIYYMWFLLENYATNAEVQSIVNNTELYFIPVLNPDGYVYNCTQDPNGGGMWRKNRRDHGNGNYGVDNNRNYDYIDGQGNSVWGTTGVSFNTNSDVFPGSGPFSEIENQAMKWFCENHDFKIALNNHTYDNSLLFPYGYDNNQYTADHNTYVAISDMMVEYNGLGMVPKISASLYPASGDSDDWMYGADLATKPKIFAFTPEISNSGFWPSTNEIESICNSMVYTNLMAAHLITNYASLNDNSPLSVSSYNGYFGYELQRLGLEDPANFIVSIVPISTNIINVGTPNNHNNMTLLQADLDSISFQLDPAISMGDLVEYHLQLDNGQYIENFLVTKIYGTQTNLITDNGNSVANWNVSQEWGTTNSDYYSPSSSITDSPNGNYSNNMNETITLNNSIDLTNAIGANMSFWAKWEIEANWDYVQVEVSNDGGSTWVPQCGKFTNLGVPDQNAADGEPLYDGFQTTWVKEEIDLSDYLGASILVRFKIVSDQGVKEDGFYFDDFEVNTMTGCINNTTASIIESACNAFTSPSGVIYTSSGIYTDVIPNSVGCDSIITIDLTIILVDTSVIQNGTTLTASQAGASYQWTDCDNSNAPIAGETNQTFTPQINGNYAVEVTYSGCVSTSSCVYVDLTDVFIHSWEGMVYYPNPVTDYLVLEMPSLNQAVEISIMDIRSKVLKQVSSTNSNVISLDMSGLSPGLYIIQLKTADELLDLKVIKK